VLALLRKHHVARIQAAAAEAEPVPVA
jgi:hypothetical protein